MYDGKSGIPRIYQDGPGAVGEQLVPIALSVLLYCRLELKIVGVVFSLIAQVLGSIFADRYLDALLCETFAQWRALYNTGEFFGRVDGERRRKAGSKNWTFAIRNNRVCTLSSANVAHADFEPSEFSIMYLRSGSNADIPESSLGPHAEILKHEPKACLAIRVVEPACVHGVHADEVAGVVLVDRRRRDEPRHVDWGLAIGTWRSIRRVACAPWR